MSRYTLTISKEPHVTFNFGFDKTLGYFYDKFNESEEIELEEASSRFNGLTGYKLASILEDVLNGQTMVLRVDGDTKRVSVATIIDRMQMDLDF